MEWEKEVDADLPYEPLSEEHVSHLSAIQSRSHSWTKAKLGNSHGVDQSKLFKTQVSPHLVQLWKDGKDLWRMFVEEQAKDAECKKCKERFEKEGSYTFQKGVQVVVEQDMVYLLGVKKMPWLLIGRSPPYSRFSQNAGLPYVSRRASNGSHGLQEDPPTYI